MSRRGNHSLSTTILLNVGGVENEYAATVEYLRYKASGDGWNEPHEPAHCELVSITLDFTPTHRVRLDDLVAEEFEAGLQEAMLEDWADDDAEAVERRAEQRRDDLMMEKF